MAGIYIHIPYCKQKCSYCNFFSVVAQKSVPTMIEAINKEIFLRSQNIASSPISTIYIGGGTPSIIGHKYLQSIFNTINKSFEISDNAEITLEANPDDINAENLDFWKRIGINRLSIGIQSFRNEDLKYLNRVHSAEKALNCIHLAREFNFDDLTIDLIYGIPGLSNEAWLENLVMFKALDIKHLSAYALTVEPNTPLHISIQKGKVMPIEEQQAADQFDILMQFMQAEGILHYEISNFCKPGHFARHNISYWQGIDYLGFGPSAHSYSSNSRQWNLSSIKDYIDSINRNVLPIESEELSEDDRYNEYVMTGLRTMWGCNLKDISSRFGMAKANYFQSNASKWIDQQLMKESNGIYTLTNSGKHFADGIASDIFYLD